jgi:hypothetical protein
MLLFGVIIAYFARQPAASDPSPAGERKHTYYREALTPVSPEVKCVSMEDPCPRDPCDV